MYTRWGRELDPTHVWPEYPRPRLVRDHWTNLNGYWDYAITPRTEPMPDAFDGRILVPFCAESPLSGVEQRVGPDQRLWYRRTVSTDPTGQRVLLHFGAVDFETVVWVNGAVAGIHRGGFDAFSVDISEFLKVGENTIVVGVTDPTSRGDQPRGKQHLNPQGIWYTPVTGIWQTVWMEHLPPDNHIDEIRIASTQACDAIDLMVGLWRPSRDPSLAAVVDIRLEGRDITRAVVRPDREVRVPVPDPVRWSPDHPVLYDVDVQLVRLSEPVIDAGFSSDGLMRVQPLHGEIERAAYAEARADTSESLDQARSYFGLRRIAIETDPKTGTPGLTLNGEPQFHLGTLDQGWWPDGLHTPPSDEAMVYEIEFLKAAGFNGVRKHIKVEPARYYWHCDRLGLLVWQDMPSGFLPGQFIAPNDQGEGRRSSRSTVQFDLELQRMIAALMDHPSIVVWVLHNEGWGQFDSQRLVNRIRDLDPSRPVNATSGWLDVGAGDFLDRHDYAPSPKGPQEPGASRSDEVRVPVLGEYGGIGWPVADHLWNPELRNWGYQTFHTRDEVQAAYRLATEAVIRLRRDSGLAGAIYTQTSDVEGEVNGLLTYDREVEKIPREWLAELHAPLTG